MHEDLESGNKRNKESVMRYASSILKESSVCAVTSIISTISIPRKVFRVVIFLLLIAAFLFQCIQFFSILFEYPSVVDIEIRTPSTYLAPSFTFCNNERIKRSKFCTKYPNHCTRPDAEFCKNYSSYCGEAETKVPKEEYFSYDFEYGEIFELGHELDGLVSPGWFSENQVLIKNVSLLRNRYENPDDASICYSANSIVGESEEPPYIQRNPFNVMEFPKYSFNFDPEENDKFDPDSKTGILFAVHSPFVAVNPFRKGYFMEPGKEYKVHIRMAEEHLLTYPYKTDCISYKNIWIHNNKSGPRSKEMCRHKCIKEFFLKCINCTFAWLLYPIDKQDICPRGARIVKNTSCPNDVYYAYEKCWENCKEECIKVKYFTEVRERDIVTRGRNNSRFPNPHLIYVDIIIDDAEIMSFIYRPQYQMVEAFSYIGGFIGIWHGVSLVQVSEFFESVFLIGRYFWKKRVRSSLQRTQ